MEPLLGLHKVNGIAVQSNKLSKLIATGLYDDDEFIGSGGSLATAKPTVCWFACHRNERQHAASSRQLYSQSVRAWLMAANDAVTPF